MASQQSQPQKDIDPILVIVGFLLVAAMGYLLWEKYHTQIATAYSWVRVVQLSPFLLLKPFWVVFIGAGLLAAVAAAVVIKKKKGTWVIATALLGISIIVGHFSNNIFNGWFDFFKYSDMSLIEWKHMSKSSFFANIFTLVFVLIPMAVWVARKSLNTNPLNHKHFAKGKDYTLHSFTDLMAKTYPHLALFRKINLTARDINAGKFRMADTEKQFAIKHDLLDRVKENTFKVNTERSAEVFRKQLGKLWQYEEDGDETQFEKIMTRNEYAVFAVLLPRLAATDISMGEEEYKEALELTEKLLAGYWNDAAATYTSTKNNAGQLKETLRVDLTLARSAVKRYRNNVKVKAFLTKHAYVLTLLYAMLLEVRSLGVLPPAEFRWLRVVDRRLWLTINNVGRIVAFAECCAVFSHYLSEKKQKRSIERPMIDGAVKGLVEAVDSFLFSEAEIEEINEILAEKENEAKATIDPETIIIEKKNIILMMTTVGSGKQRDINEVALLAENGSTIYRQKCTTGGEVSESLPSSAAVRARLLELCNGQHVITFDKNDLALVPGIDRTASSIEECKGDEGFDIVGAAIMEGVIDETEVTEINDALAAASLCRQIWVVQRKAMMEKSLKKGGV